MAPFRFSVAGRRDRGAGRARAGRSIRLTIRTRSRSGRFLRSAPQALRKAQDPGLCRARAASPARRRTQSGRRIARVVRGRSRQSAISAVARTSDRPVPRKCGRARAVAKDDFVLHPYPVTPFHGDYLHHADLAAAAKTRFSRALGAAGATSRSRRRGSAGANAIPMVRAPPTGTPRSPRSTPPNSRPHDTRGERLARAALGRTGWFHAERLLADAVSDPAAKTRRADLRRLRAGDFNGSRGAHQSRARSRRLAHGGCRTIVAGYTVKREYVNVEFSAGIENIGLRLHRGPAVADVHPHGEAQGLSVERLAHARHRSRARAAWNPIGGLTDAFGG